MVLQQGLQRGKLRHRGKDEGAGLEEQGSHPLGCSEAAPSFHGGEPELLRLNQTPPFFTQASVDVRILKLL